ncbi:MAG: tetratricopeptide repeat protein [Anaerolineales bacterium]|nr:tetratricopeptide repeat protein [Anaerolineales bacterium]
MYLKGSNWNMRKRPRNSTRRSQPIFFIPLFIIVLLALYLAGKILTTTPGIASSVTLTPTTNPEVLLTEAENYFSEGNLDRAIETYKKAVLLDAGNPLIYTELARLQILTGQYEAAETSARNALLLSPENPTALALLGWTLIYLENPADAQEVLLRAISNDNGNAMAHAFYGQLLADQGDYLTAGDESRKAVELAPDSLEVLFTRGYVLEMTANYDEAIEYYNKALAINRNIADIHLSKGRVYRAMDDYEEAINAFVQANALNPEDPLPDTYMALTYLTYGEYAKAVQAAEKAAQEDPSNPYRYGNLGVAYYRNENFFEAVDAFTLAIQGGEIDGNVIVQGLPLDYDTVGQYYQLYMLSLAYTGQCSKALPVAQAVISGLSQDPDAVYNAQYAIDFCEENADNIFPTQEPTAEPIITE